MQQLRRWPWFVAILVLLAVGSTAAAIKSNGSTRPDRPAGWDRRVVDLVRFVERTRGLRFARAVRTDFLTDAAFRKAVTSDATEPMDTTHLEGVFRALGLVQGELDLRQATDTLNGEGIVGLYDPDTDRILIRGDRITVGMRSTIVHELTHALQAQHFDLEPDTQVSGEDIAFTSLVEADALRVEDRYIDSLSPGERRAVDAADRAQAAAADLGGVPEILTELFSLPYVLGPPFLDAVAADGGEAAVNRAFRKPPVSEEQIVDPDAYLAGDRPVRVPSPKLARGERRVDDPDDFGMISLLLVLGERLPFSQAWTAVEGWAGDASVGYRTAGRDCIRVRVALDSQGDAGELEAAVRAWAAGRSTTDVRRQGRTVEWSSCDPGTATTRTTPPGRPRTFDLLQLRVELVASLEEGGASAPQARCVADAVFRDNDPASLLLVARITDEKNPRLVRLQRDVQAAAKRCAG